MAVLDKYPLDFADPRIQELRRVLTQLYPSAQRARMVVETAGVDTSLIYFEQAPVDMWHEVLRTTANAGACRKLVEQVVGLLPTQAPARPTLEALLNDGPVATDAPKTNAQGKVEFIEGSDEVMQLEGLLFHDDLMQTTGSVRRLRKTLGVLVERANAVCKIDASFGGRMKTGTAFRVAARWLLTNHHVLFHDGAKADAVSLTWGYEIDESGALAAGTAVVADASNIVGDASDDWALIACDGLAADVPVIDLRSSAVPVVKKGAFIVQHPGGTPKRIGFVRNTITAVSDRVVHYLTDTQEGSSGSPVFDDNGALIALHHAGGNPQEIVGRAPMKKNEGIRIERVLEGISHQGIALAYT